MDVKRFTAFVTKYIFQFYSTIFYYKYYSLTSTVLTMITVKRTFSSVSEVFLKKTEWKLVKWMRRMLSQPSVTEYLKFIDKEN